MGNGLVCVIVLRNRHMRTVTNIFILNLAVSDLLVGIFCIPTTLVDNLITGERRGPLYSCYETWPDPEMRKVYTTVLFLHIYVIPLALIVLMYGRIGAKLYATAVLASAEQPDVPVSQRKIRVIKMLIVVALLFMLSWLPLWTLMLLTDYARPDEDNLELLTSYIFPLSHWLAFSNSSVNPIIYGYFNENFKRGFQAACQHQACCWGRKKTRFSIKRPRAGSPLNTAVSGHPLSLGSRMNRIFTESDLTGCVRLEMDTKGSSAEGGNSSMSTKREIHFEEIEKVSSAGGKIYNAWER